LLFRVSSARAQGAGDQAAVYTDALQNGWQYYGWAALNYNTHLTQSWCGTALKAADLRLVREHYATRRTTP
jgi:hypothetical protein